MDYLLYTPASDTSLDCPPGLLDGPGVDMPAPSVSSGARMPNLGICKSAGTGTVAADVLDPSSAKSTVQHLRVATSAGGEPITSAGMETSARLKASAELEVGDFETLADSETSARE